MLSKLKTLKVKFSVITFFTYLTLILVVLFACYLRFYQIMIDNYTNMGEEILNLASSHIEIDHIPDYLSGEYDEEEYARTAENLDQYTYYFKELYYLYAFKIYDDSTNATVIFDAYTVANGEGETLGSSYEMEDELIEQMDAIRKGEDIKPLTGKTEWGFLITCSKPLIDSKGVCQGYLFVDFNLTDVRRSNIGFIGNLFVLIFCLMLVILFLAMKAVADRITVPIEKMYLCLKNFKYKTEEDRQKNIENLKSLDIHTNPEIQSLYETLTKTIESSYKFEREFEITSEKLESVKGKVYVDALTGLGNKYAYEQKLKEYQEKTDKGENSNMAVVIADVNNLKYVNDTFGHERGDLYIKGCCKVLADVFGEENICRIGGDEFVIFIENENFTSRYINLDKAEEKFTACYENKSIADYERYSASLGIANYMVGSNDNLIEVIKEADKKMYEKKQAFKAKYGSYR